MLASSNTMASSVFADQDDAGRQRAHAVLGDVVGRQRRLLRRFPYDRIADGDIRDYVLDADEDREVPGHDGGRDASRSAVLE